VITQYLVATFSQKKKVIYNQLPNQDFGALEAESENFFNIKLIFYSARLHILHTDLTMK